MKYKIKAIKTLSRIIEVEADSEDAAFEKIQDMHANEDFVLDGGDFDSVEFYPVSTKF